MTGYSKEMQKLRGRQDNTKSHINSHLLFFFIRSGVIIITFNDIFYKCAMMMMMVSVNKVPNRSPFSLLSNGNQLM